MDDDGRPVREPCGIGPPCQDRGKALSERGGQRGSGAPRVYRREDRPPRVIDTILDGRAVALSRISPLAMREEVFDRPGLEAAPASVGVDAQRGVFRPVTPLVRSTLR